MTELRDFVAALFADDSTPTVPPADEQPTRGNVVPKEGKSPVGPPSHDRIREFTRDLFGYGD